MRDKGENIYRVSETERLEVTEKITAHLKGYDDVVFAYLFGSFIDQELGYFRDIDIAVFIIDTKGGSTMAREITLANAIQEAIDYQYPVDMKVLVTGGCGFLGSHVCEYYIHKGWGVISYDNMTKHELIRTGFAAESARLYNWDYLKSISVEMVLADVRDLKQLMDYANGCDYIIHTAAQPAMTISWEAPELDITTNIIGTFNVLE